MRPRSCAQALKFAEICPKPVTMRYLFHMLFFLASGCVLAQNASPAFTAEIANHRQQYKDDFIRHSYSPLKATDTSLLDFHAPDTTWRFPAIFTLRQDAQPFNMLTYSGVKQLYRIYGTLQIDVNGQPYTLQLYQNMGLLQDSAYQDYLFLPFKDLTNGEQTYEGGRYLDFRTDDIRNGVLVVDFNKAYNPYCAYSDGYSCPIPPKENHLDLAVKAGEKTFRGTKKH